MTGSTFGGANGRSYGVRHDEEDDGTVQRIGAGTTYGETAIPPVSTTWLIGRSRVDSLEAPHPDITIGETATFDVICDPNGLPNHLNRYEQLRDRILYASDTVTTGRTYDGTPWFRERHDRESLVVALEPGRDVQTGARGVWGIIEGGSDSTGLPADLARLSIEVYVLAEIDEYADRSAVRDALGR